MKSFYEMIRIIEGYYDDYDNRRMPYAFKRLGLSTEPDDWDRIGQGEFNIGQEFFDYIGSDKDGSYDGKIEIEYEREGLDDDTEIMVPWPLSWKATGPVSVYPPDWEEGVQFQNYPNPGRHLELVPAEVRKAIIDLVRDRMEFRYEKAFRHPYKFEFMPNGSIQIK